MWVDTFWTSPIFLSLLLAMIAPIAFYVLVLRRRKLRIETLADGRLKIVYRWIHSWHLTTLAMFVWVIGIFMSPRPAPPQESQPLLFWIILCTIWIIIIYFALTGLVNRSIITMDPLGKTITSMYGPLPVLRRQRRQIGFVANIYYEKSISGRWPPIWRYPIFAKDFSGKTMGIVNEIDWEADAMLVATTLREALDIPVPPG
ncbi:MAG: hypothetical protein H6644_06540 [Caldilineaceae bacterium]|nr:hypothetical protein [Caldilineaceae bacterium]